MMKLFFWVFALLFTVNGFTTVRILTFHYNQPDFVELQYRALKKFLADEFELIVFNDAKTIENEKGIENYCHQLGIKCVRFEPEWHHPNPLNTYLKARLQEPSVMAYWGWDALTSTEEIAKNPSVRHSHVIQYALDHYGYDHDDIVVIMDGDNFLIKPISIRDMLKNYDIVGFDPRPDVRGNGRKQLQIAVPQNTELLWVVFVAFDPRKLPDIRELQFHVDVVSDNPYLANNTIADTGAAVYGYLQRHPELKILAYHWQDSGTFREYFSYEELKRIEFSDRLIRFINDIRPGNVQFFVFEHFIHFAAVSVEFSCHERKAHYLRQLMNEILE